MLQSLYQLVFGVKIEGVDCVRLSNHLVLSNVIYIPEFQLSLMSVSQVTKDLGYRIMFDDHIKGLMTRHGEEIAKPYVLGTKYLPAISTTKDLKFCSYVVDDYVMWHNRLRHSFMSKTEFLSDVLSFKEKNKSHHYVICHLAKQKHLSYNSHNNMCDSSFDMLHMGTVFCTCY